MILLAAVAVALCIPPPALAYGPVLSMSDTKPHAVVVGAGWGGWGAAKALCENGCKVTLLDGLPDPTGAKPYLTPTGKPFEPGVRGFWKDYPNIVDLLGQVGLEESDVFTPFTGSSFFSPYGLEATAPVFGDGPFKLPGPLSSLPITLPDELPSPLGQVLATFPNFKRIPVKDRTTMLGLLYAMLDFQRDEKTFEAYDRMTAHELFIRMGVSKRLVDDFIKPTLLVGLFKPPEELSAAVAMELLYYYALAHQTSFDVRWMKKDSIATQIINPLAESLLENYDIEVKGGCLVEELQVADGRVSGIKYKERSGEGGEISDISACVLAVGAKGMKGIVSGSPALAEASPELTKAASLDSIDVMAVRLWLDTYVPTETPANVWSRFESQRGAGGTFFMLDDLQKEHEEELWGGEKPQGSVVACDFYNAGALINLSDETIIKTIIDELLPAAVPGFAGVEVVDSFVQRYPKAVSWFSPGSYTKRPPLEVAGFSNLVCAGDWVRMGDREHGAKGLCQERAYVSGLQAANVLAERGVLGGDYASQHTVIPIRDDEPQVKVGRAVNSRLQGLLGPLASPWVR
ncbi:unnamed protein product [Chrysoparadoxa australica]